MVQRGAGLCSGQLPQFGRERESGLSVGWSLLAAISCYKSLVSRCSAGDDFLHPSVLLVRSCALPCPGLPWSALVFPGGTRRLVDLIPILHAPNVPVCLPLPCNSVPPPPSHRRPPLILVCVARGAFPDMSPAGSILSSPSFICAHRYPHFH